MATEPVSPPSAPAGGFEPPSLAKRFGALVIDWVLCLLASQFIGDPLRDGWPPVAVLIAEYGFFIGLFAQTPGMAMTKLRCVSFSDGGRIGVVRALVRGVLLSLVVPALIMDPNKRGLHDKAAGSVMVDAVPPQSRA
ncbi:RDD family protein [Phytohabitans aurantiacus]|uniref:RDD family protein n=1 Tax=Phytohabitans aurantiacus TaxID=3016789 RepID=A0ABQ5R8R9_9ACTN|nr:RDD family protein [Phytohabitans aurantiacus]GLI03045.1 RDD family protein [Phytohabitans aurantiacus]